MRIGLQTEIRRIILLAIFLLALGFGLGYPLQILILGFAVYMGWTFRTINEIYQWLESGERGLPPQSSGVWGDIIESLYKQRRRNEKSKEKLRLTVRRVRQLNEALDDGIVLLTEDRTLDWWNQSAKRLLGLKRSDRNSPIVNLLRDPKFVQYLALGNYEERVEINSAIKIGSKLSIKASIFGDNEMVLVIHDVTRIRNLEEMRKEFVANISHELRTPLTVLIGHIETLREASGSIAGLKRVLPAMDSQAQRIKSLADDLVMLSRLEAEETKLKNTPFQIKPLLEKIVEEATVISNGEHKLEINCADDIELNGSKKELHSAFSNLVINAIRHNPQGATVRVKVGKHKDHISVAVEDDGIGIDPIHIPRLTERFFRVDRGRNSTSGGTGLGLAIVKHVLQRHDATLEIHSYPNRGSRFICRF